MCLDFCFPDPPLTPLTLLDIDAVKRGIKRARIDNYQMFCKSHWGTAAYNTKVGKKHAGLKDTDFVGELRQFLNDEDIKFTAYYSVGFDEHIVRTHPEWACRDENGKLIALLDNQFAFHWVCMHSGYSKYCLDQFEEIIDGYHPDGLMLDIMSPPICYCESCQNSFRNRYAMDIPRRDDQECYWRQLLELRDRIVVLGFVQQVRELINLKCPEMILTINGGPIDFRRETLNHTDFDFAEHHAEGGLWDACWRGLDPNNMPMVAVSPDPYDPYPVESIITSAALSVAQNTMPNFGSFTFKPDGSLNKLDLINTGQAFGEIQKIEPYLRDRQSVKSIAVLYSENTRLYDNHDVIGHNSGYQRCRSFTEGLLGTLELCNYSKYPFDAISEDHILEGQLSQYESLILPNVTCMSAEIASEIRTFVRAGGILFISHRTGLKDEFGYDLPNFQLSELMGCNFARMRNEYALNVWGGYVNRCEHPIWKDMPEADLSFMGPFVETTPNNGIAVATHKLPLATGRALVPSFLPPSQSTDYPAIYMNDYGNGRVVYFSFNFFRIENSQGGNRGGKLRMKWPTRLFSNLLRELIPSPKIRNEMSANEAITVSYHMKNTAEQIIIHQVNDSIIKLNGTLVPIDGGTIYITDKFMVAKSAQQVYPKSQELQVTRGNGYCQIRMPTVDVHTVITVSG
jgi:hypothetical protein